MKGTDAFKQTIGNYLKNLAERDPLFAKTFQKPNKNIDDCITCIFNTVHALGVCGLEDNEVFAMAVHYYDEDELEIGAPMSNCQVVVNHTIELTPEEIEEAKKEARAKILRDEYNRMHLHKALPKSKSDNQPTQKSLF